MVYAEFLYINTGMCNSDNHHMIIHNQISRGKIGISHALIIEIACFCTKPLIYTLLHIWIKILTFWEVSTIYVTWALMGKICLPSQFHGNLGRLWESLKAMCCAPELSWNLFQVIPCAQCMRDYLKCHKLLASSWELHPVLLCSTPPKSTPHTVMLSGIPPSINHVVAQKLASNGRPVSSLRLLFALCLITYNDQHFDLLQ